MNNNRNNQSLIRFFYKGIMVKPIISLFLVTGILTQSVLFPIRCLAWEQNGHQAINQEAEQKAQTQYSASPKFSNAPVDLNLKLMGPFTSSSSLLANSVGGLTEGYTVIPTTNTVAQWIIHGGFSADEPNLYASVRHFYDPRAVAGVHELTDHNRIHGYYDKAVSALDWAFTNPNNPFNFKNALLYYKKSMEILEDGSSPQDIPQNGNFRDLAYTPATKAIERSFYLGKAFRSLGETMHMISDMAMPAHVRNDSHPNGDLDSVEAYTKPYMIHSAANYDTLPGVNLDETPQKNFVNLAFFINATFYSKDTIYDKALGVMPGNGEPPYDKPKLSDFKRVEEKGHAVYYKTVPISRALGSDVPMVRESLATKIFGMQVKGAGYSVPYYYAYDYVDLLAPLAIKASYRLYYSFFPTFQLTLHSNEESLSDDEEKLGIRKKFKLDADLLHDVSKDPVWKEAGLQIKYSGPADLFRQSGGKKTKIAEVIFEKGNMSKIKVAGSDREFQAVDEPVRLYVWESSKKVEKPAGFPDELDIKNFLIDNGESVYLQIKAGARTITGNSFTYQEKEIKLDFAKKDYESVALAKLGLTAVAQNAPRNVKYAWNFGDGTSMTVTPVPTASHQYEKEGQYHVDLEMIDARNNSVLVSAVTSIAVSNFYGNWRLTYTITEASSVDWLINWFAKGLIWIIKRIFPQAEINDDPKITIKGTEMTCTMKISPPPPDNPKGNITVVLQQLKSSTDFVEPAKEPWNGTVTVNDENLIFRFAGASSNGSGTNISAITFKGKLEKTNIGGTFNAVVFSGTFQASKQ